MILYGAIFLQVLLFTIEVTITQDFEQLLDLSPSSPSTIEIAITQDFEQLLDLSPSSPSTIEVAITQDFEQLLDFSPSFPFHDRSCNYRRF
jgi:hypothetical protein